MKIEKGIYPKEYHEWNARLIDLFLEGIENFNPELVTGSMEALKIAYITKGVLISKDKDSV